MADKQTVEAVVYRSMAEAFQKPQEYFEEHPELRLREDLAAKSMEYFPLIADIEDGLGISVEYHDFQTMASTVGATVEYVAALCEAQGK